MNWVQPPAPRPIKLELPLPYLDFVEPPEVAPQVSSQSQGSPLHLHPCLYCTRIQDGFTVPPFTPRDRLGGGTSSRILCLQGEPGTVAPWGGGQGPQACQSLNQLLVSGLGSAEGGRRRTGVGDQGRTGVLGVSAGGPQGILGTSLIVAEVWRRYFSFRLQLLSRLG